MASRFGILLTLLLTILFAAQTIAPEFPRTLTVWNVGQGQWVTISDDAGCWHFDMGGEFAPWKAIMRECRTRENFVWLSHWDMDHVNFTGTARRLLPRICFLGRPSGPASQTKLNRLEGSRDCVDRIGFNHWDGASEGEANERSRVVLTSHVLIPGDSTRTQEKIWIRAFENLRDTEILVLGHHGSRTSTSKELMKRIVSLKLAIASARFRRYGHPHREVESLLRYSRVPLLKTEDWGSIRIQL